MKNFKTLLLIAVFTLGIGGVATAQKIGHIDTDLLIKSMPATKAMQAELEKTQKSYKDDIEALGKKFDAKLQKYAAEEKAQTADTNEKRKLEMQQEGARIQQAEQDANQEIQKKYQELMEPILEKAQKAIKEVAAEKGLIYVFNSAPGKGLLIFEKGIDIFDAVKAKLGF